MNDVQEIISLLDSPTAEDIALVKKAYEFAQNTHKDQKRLSGEPYFNHLFATAKILANIHMGAVTVSAGFLHDAIEDADATAETVEKEFGPEIKFLVEGVTKLGKLKYHGAERHSESLRKLFVAMSQDIRVLIIKLADRLHNMQTLQFVPKDKQFRIAKETLEIYAPLAYRLGIRKLERELEDISFSYVYPKEYEETKKLLGAKKSEQEDGLIKFHKSIKKGLGKNNITDFHTDYRVKGFYSLYKKLKKNNMDIEKVHDVSALRIIVPTVADCYKILGIVHSVWRPLTGRIKDYISSPKPNGYQSLHTTVFTGDGGIVEVQIRTKEMHDEAEYGIASHISYKQKLKKKVTNPNLLWIKKILPIIKNRSDTDVNDKLQYSKNINMNGVPKWVKELVEYQKSNNADNFIDDIKNDFLKQGVFVFTPKGDVVDLPKGSSVIDFAYSIHSDIGNHMSGAKVNGKLVSIDTILQNGDIVEIQTKSSAKPSRKWIDMAETTLAKRHIRNSLG